MSGSDDLDAALRETAAEMDALREIGQPILEGPATVQLVMSVEGAMTPQEAVALATRRLSEGGTNSVTFAVIDRETESTYFVRAGYLVQLEELREEIEAGVPPQVETLRQAEQVQDEHRDGGT